jgi:tetratricopeptide (TPR) repeat protein
MSFSDEIPVKSSAAARPDRLISVRVSSGNYWAALFVMTFVAGLLWQLNFPVVAWVVVFVSWTVVPTLAITDRVTFDGVALRRRGLFPFLSRTISQRETLVGVDEIESVVTIAVRTLRSAGRIYFRYRSEIASDGRRITLVSGGRQYRDLVRRLYPLIADAKMDVRSCELRDYLVEPQGLETSLRLLNLASSSVLADAIDLPRGKNKTRSSGNMRNFRQAPETARGILLQRVANELRIAGRWRQAAEAFRRALMLLPRDSRLLMEFGRFVHSQGNAMRNARLHRRAKAALRLAAINSAKDPSLLARVGESCFEFGDPERAARLFRQALVAEPHLFRAELGLAEVALMEGKLAHVIHHFTSAAAIAPDAALRRFAQREIEYYRNLNQNDEYLSTELRRVSWLHNIIAARRITTRLTASGLALALAGAFLDEKLAVIGWALATSALAGWCGLLVTGRLLSARRPVNSGDDG